MIFQDSSISKSKSTTEKYVFAKAVDTSRKLRNTLKVEVK